MKFILAIQFILSSLLLFSQNPIQLQSGNYFLPAYTVDEGDQLNPNTEDDLVRIIQFTRPLEQSELDLFKKICNVINYLPKHSYIISLKDDISNITVNNFPIYAITRQLPSMKMTAPLAHGDYPSWCLLPNGYIQIKAQLNPFQTSINTTNHIERYADVIQWNDEWVDIQLPISSIETLAQEPAIIAIQPMEAPGEPENLPGRKNHRSNTINTSYPSGIEFDGTGVVVGHGDDGAIGPHIDYEGRILADKSGTSSGNHGDHVAGTIFGAGNRDPYGEGMAKGAELVYYTYPSNLSSIDQDYGTYNIRITNSSYSNGCNAGYTSFSSQVDDDMIQHDKLIHVFSAGNNGASNCSYGAGAGWGNITGGHKQGKNVLAVANLSSSDVLASTSSRGPADDGRIKPEVSAVGTAVYSTSNPNTYVTMSGTSMACPGTVGTLAQLYQAFKEENGQIEPEGGLMKALLMNGSDDIGNPGPDFKHGYGRINARRSYGMIQNNWIITDSISQGQTDTYSISIPSGIKEVKIMIHWTDPAGNVSSAYALVNDLNMSVTNEGVTYLPWVLDPTPNATLLNSNAVRAIDSLNNAEQITIENPVVGNLSIAVTGYNIPLGTQKYWIVYDLIPEEIVLTYPFGGESLLPGTSTTLYWDATGITGSFNLEYSTNGVNWSPISTVPNAQRTFNWNVPNITTDSLFVRVSSGTISDVNNAPCTVIGTPSNLMVDWACPDSTHLVWNPVPGATSYTLYLLGNKYMDSIITVVNNEATIPSDLSKVQWYSVAARYNQGVGIRANAIEKPIGLMNCVLTDELELYSVINPTQSLYPECTSNLTLDILVKNNGLMDIDTIAFAYQLNNLPIVRDTLYVLIQSGFSKTFNQIATLSNLSSGSHTLSIWLELTNDQNSTNDSLFIPFQIASSSPASIPVLEDFDNQSNCSSTSSCNTTVCTINGAFANIDNGTFDDIDWRISSGSTPTPSTGPTSDHGGNGKYIYLEASNCTYQEGILLSDCIDLSNASSPILSFWLHMYGSSQGELHLDVLHNGKWELDIIPMISGDLGNQWNNYTVNLFQYVGDVISIRFRGITGSGNYSDIALDDLSIDESTSPPIADFSLSKNRPCSNESISLIEQSKNGANQFLWSVQPNTISFVNGTDSTSYSPQMIFAPGNYSIRFIASNSYGSDTIIKTIEVFGPQPLPIIEDFESSQLTDGWEVQNADQSVTWNYTSVFGPKGQVTTAMYVNNFNYSSPGEVDAIQTFTIDLPSGNSNAVLYFDYAYALRTGSSSDRLLWQISDDCGSTFTTLFDQSGTGLATGSTRSNAFYPSSAEWRTDSIELSQLNYSGEVVLRVVNITSGGNNLFLDNILIYDRSVSLPSPTFNNALDTCASDVHTFECTNPQLNEIHKWDFTTSGNPSQVTGPGPHQITFNHGGYITVKHTVYGPGGEKMTSFTQQYSSDVVANFNFSSPSAQVVQFNNTSTFSPDSVLWAFGDGSSDTSNNPLHTYSSGGTYLVTLYAFGSCNVSKKDQTIVVSGIGLAEFEQEIAVYPNPAKDYIDIILGNTLDKVNFRLINSVGQVLMDSRLDSNTNRINISQWPSGVYVMYFESSGEVTNRKLIIQH